MQELAKILEEIDHYVKVYKTPPFGREIEGTVELLERCRDIIRKHINDGWIPVEKFGLPKSNEHDFGFWITIQYVNGFRRTIKAKWDWFNKCFMHQNGKKISEDVVAYKYYSAPEPYRPERDGEKNSNETQEN